MWDGKIERRVASEIHLSQLQSDVSVIATKMELHDEQSQEFRKDMKNTMVKISEAMFGNGKPGLNVRLKYLEDASIRGKALWTMLITIISGIIIISGGAWIKSKLGL